MEPTFEPEFQTRGNGELNFFKTFKDAVEKSKKDPSIWKISYSTTVNGKTEDHRWVKYVKAEFFEPSVCRTQTWENGKVKEVIQEIRKPRDEFKKACSLNPIFASLPEDDSKTVFWMDQPFDNRGFYQKNKFWDIKDVKTNEEFLKML